MDPVGREEELAALRAALDDVTGGAGRVVLISGDPGIGKTTVVDAFRQDVEAVGATWLWGAAWEGGGAPAYWPWVQVVRAAARVAGEAVTARGGDLGPLGPAGPSAVVSDQFRLYDAVAGLLATLSEQAPVVVVLEDLHAAGAATVCLLEFVARFDRHVRVLMIGTYRPAEVAPDDELSATLARLEDIGTALSPAPLAASDIAAVLEAGGVHPAPELVAEVAERTQGNPLFIAHVARRLAAGGTTAEAGLPLGLRNAFRRQAERAAATGDVPEALDAAAVLGVDLSVEVLAAILGVAPKQVRPVLDAAVTTGLLRPDRTEPDRYEFAHAVVRDALHVGLSPARRAELHLLTGRVLAAVGTEPDRLAHHFACAWPAGGVREAAQQCRLAGDRATAAHAHAEAVAWFSDALTALGRIPDTEPVDRCALLIKLAAARFRAGRTAEGHDAARLAGDLARSIGDVELISSAALLQASHLPFNTVKDEAIAALRYADERWTDRVSATRAAVLARLAGVVAAVDRRDAAAIAERAEEVALALGADVPERERRAALAAALTAQLDVAWGRHDPAEARIVAGRLRSTAVEPATEAAAAIWETVFSLELGDTAAAEDAVRALESLAARERQPTIRHLALSRRAMLTLLRGDLVSGLSQAHEAWAVAENAGLPDGDAVVWGQFFAAWRQSGLGADDTTTMERIATDLTETSPFAAAHAGAVVQMLAARGDVSEASRLFDRTMAGLDALDQDLLYAWTVALLAECAVVLDDTAAGAVLYERLLPIGDRFVVAAGGVVCIGSASHQLGLLARLLGRPDAARRHLEVALDAHRSAICTELATASERLLAERAPTVAELDIDGQVVTARYGNDVVRLPASLGLRYLGLLLANPRVDIRATHLASLASHADGRSAGGRADSPDAPVRPSDAVLDHAALVAFRSRLADIDSELDEAAAWNDSGRAANLEEERSFILEELSRAVGLGGRTRRFTDEGERARVNVTRAIRSAIRKIKPQAVELAAHLDRCVTTGGRCRYDPDLDPSS